MSKSALSLATFALFSVVALVVQGGRAAAESQVPAALAVDDAMTQSVERQFSPTTAAPRSAPVIWSSRLQVRWNARWQDAPKYVV
jgi:hypothetical protein